MNKYFILLYVKDYDYGEENWSYLINWSEKEEDEWNNDYPNVCTYSNLHGTFGTPDNIVKVMMDQGGWFSQEGYPYLFDTIKQAQEALLVIKANHVGDKSIRYKYYIIEVGVVYRPDYLGKVIKA